VVLRKRPRLAVLDHSLPDSGAPGAPEQLAAVLAVVSVAAYLVAAYRLRRRGDTWPGRRGVSFAAGAAALATTALVPPPGGEFTAHMLQHLVVGMAVPLLLVLARPLTLALRTLPTGGVRRGLLAILHSRVATVLLFPPLAALMDAGGLWVLYRTGLFADVRDRPWLHAAVHTHILAAGILFTVATCQLDPLRRRYSLALRAAALVAASASHAVLARSLYSTAPPGTDLATGDVHAAAELMYYGGDLIEIALAAVLAVGWYNAAGRAQARVRRRTTAAVRPAGHGLQDPAG
jgi:putative membrane protein